MTGERPPEWVVELVFSFVNANVNTAFLFGTGWRFWPPVAWVPRRLFEKSGGLGAIGILEGSKQVNDFRFGVVQR